MAHLDFSLELSRFACGVAIGPRATCRGRLLALTVVGCRVQFEADWVAMTKITVASAARAAMYSPGAFFDRPTFETRAVLLRSLRWLRQPMLREFDWLPVLLLMVSWSHARACSTATNSLIGRSPAARFVNRLTYPIISRLAATMATGPRGS